MGKAWAGKHPIAHATFAEADDVLGFALSKLCFEGPEDQLNRTDNAQAAIYTTSVACFRALGVLPGATAGLSLGEFTALHLAGAFSFADGLKLVRLRGQAMQDAAEASQSTMVAITGDVSEAKIRELCERTLAETSGGVLVPANYNSPMQVVISGDVAACERSIPMAEQMGLRATPLTVAGAFHSPIMLAAGERLAAALAQVEWSQPTIPVLSNVTGEPHARDIGSIQRRLVEQLTHPVRWSQSMQWAATNLPGRYVELAPGKVLTGLMRRIDKNVKVENYAEPKSDA